MKRLVFRRLAPFVAAAALGGAAFGMLGAGAAAAPTHAKNAFTLQATCQTGQTTLSGWVVVNSGNGQGGGQEDRNTGTWSAAQFYLPTHLVFTPTALDIAFLFDGQPAGGIDVAKQPEGDTTCTVSGSQSFEGHTFSASGSVVGNLH